MKFFIASRIGRRKVRDMKRSDIAELHHELRETPYQANWTLGVLSKMFTLTAAAYNLVRLPKLLAEAPT